MVYVFVVMGFGVLNVKNFVFMLMVNCVVKKEFVICRLVIVNVLKILFKGVISVC